MYPRLVHTSVAIIALAWMLFLLSFMLPARNSQSGWETFTGSIAMIFAYPLLLVAVPQLAPVLIVPFANLLMLMSPFLAFILRDNSGVLAVFLVPSAVSIWLLPHGFLGDLAIGFYVWQGSFFAMSVGCILASLTFTSWDDTDETAAAKLSR